MLLENKILSFEEGERILSQKKRSLSIEEESFFAFIKDGFLSYYCFDIAKIFLSLREADYFLHENEDIFLFSSFPFEQESFSPKFFLPKMLFVFDERRNECTIFEATSQEEIPSWSFPQHQFMETSFDEWEKRVQGIKKSIEQNKYQKIVLSRITQEKIAEEKNSHFLHYWENLIQVHQDKSHNNETFFCFSLGQQRIFLGRTPEHLFHQEGKNISVMALAGTKKNSSEKDLLSSAKDLEEHQYVCDFIEEKFKDKTGVLSSSPLFIYKLRTLEHLCRLYQFKSSHSISPLHLVEMLHPTPALCGLPQETAKEEIKNIEYFPRGLFGAPFGFINKKKSSLFIGIRSAIISFKENQMTCFAGCGVVRDSDPLSEWQETEKKMACIKNILQ